MDTSPKTFMYHDGGMENTQKYRGIKFSYFCPFWQIEKLKYREDGILKNLCIERVRRLKNSTDDEDLVVINQMVEQALDAFERYHKFDSFDCIVMVPSTSHLNPLIQASIAARLSTPKILDGLLKKLPFSEAKVDWDMVNHEKSPHTKSYMQKLATTYARRNDEFQAKKVAQSCRRYFYDWQAIQLPDNHPFIQQLKKAKTILIPDDTVAESTSMVECAAQIRKINPTATIVGFSLVRDVYDDKVKEQVEQYKNKMNTEERQSLIRSMASNYDTLTAKDKIELSIAIRQDVEEESKIARAKANELESLLGTVAGTTGIVINKPKSKVGRKPSGWWTNKVEGAEKKFNLDLSNTSPSELYDLMVSDPDITGMVRKDALKRISQTRDMLLEDRKSAPAAA